MWHAEIYLCTRCSGNPDSNVQKLRGYSNRFAPPGINVKIGSSGCMSICSGDAVSLTLSGPETPYSYISPPTCRLQFTRSDTPHFSKLPEPVTQLIDGLDSIRKGMEIDSKNLEERIVKEVTRITGHDRKQYRAGEGTRPPFVWHDDDSPLVAEYIKTGELSFFSQDLKYIGNAVLTSGFRSDGQRRRTRVYKFQETGSKLESYFSRKKYSDDYTGADLLFNVQQFPDGTSSRFYGCVPHNGPTLVYKIKNDRLVRDSELFFHDTHSEWTKSNEFIWKNAEPLVGNDGTFFIVYRQNFDKNGIVAEEEGRVVQFNYRTISVKVVRRAKNNKFSLHPADNRQNARRLFQRLVPRPMR